METTTATTLAPVIEMVKLQTRLFSNTIAGVSDENGDDRLTDHTNHLKWLTGHLVSTRYMLANIAGIEAAEPYPELFAKGKGIETDANYPSLNELSRDWESISAQLLEKLQAMDEDALNTTPPIQVPVEDQTMRGMMTFFLHHEAYHIGQMGYLRKYHGYEAMSYK